MSLRELAASLERAQKAVVRFDAGQLSLETARQQVLCTELRQLYVGPTTGNSDDQLAEPASRSPETLLGLGSEIQRVEGEVFRLNALYKELLRRSRRTVDIFCRILAYSGNTYKPEIHNLDSQLTKE